MCNFGDMSKYAIAFACVALLSCTGEKDAGLVELDLLSHGMPIVVRAPEDATIEKMDLVVQKDLTIKSGDDFYIQIFESDASTRDVAEIKSRLLRDVRDGKYFGEIIREDPQGFIYTNVIDSAYVNYGFRHVRLQGDKEYVFQAGLRGKFTLENIERMYAAVQ